MSLEPFKFLVELLYCFIRIIEMVYKVLKKYWKEDEKERKLWKAIQNWP